MNNIKRVSVPELMDGRYFYIPSYQRGFRWTPKQVAALLYDLFSYANDKHDSNKVNEEDYYCLQPIVARKIIDKQEYETLAGAYNIPNGKDVWEIIDGQQRLTTTYILYLYLMKKNNVTIDSLQRDFKKELYHIIYATRKDSSIYLKNIDSYPSNNTDNIDFHHMQMAYETIDKWFYSEDVFDGINAEKLCSRYQLDPVPSTAYKILWDLFNSKRGFKSSYGSVQFLWYELDGGKDAIQEFRETNMNQIRLTNAELIKALFLKTLNVHAQELLERANQWESVENTLQDNTFWSFLNRKGYDLPNRIDMLFKLRYQTECLKTCEIKKKDKEVKKTSLSDEEIKRQLAICNKKLTEKDYLFNYFNTKFDGLKKEDLSNKIKDEWQEIISIFHTLEDWYGDVICYNLIGMLSQFDNSELAVYYYKFISMDENDSREIFKSYLKSEVKKHFNKIKYVDYQLSLSYGDKLVFNLLLLLNINYLNKQAEGSKNIDRHDFIYKFPFDVLQHDWDIEHIDSFTTNQLKEKSDKEKWVEVAKTDLGIEDEKLNKYIEQEKWDDAINVLKALAKEPEISDDAKNNISNLTLLDAETNRSYGNSLFVTKRKIIIERMKSGKYVPVTTSYVFMKLFDDSGVSRSNWGEQDMKKYHDYICSELVDYLPESKEK